MEVCVKLLLLLILLQVTEGGFVNFFCPRFPPAEGKNESLIQTCDLECINQHGAAGGICGDPSKGDYNCCCGPPTGKRSEKSLQCYIPNDERFNKLCNVDCICNNGADGGYCNWDLQICVCTGVNPTNVNCDLRSKKEFALFVNKLIGKKDLKPIQLAVIANGIQFSDK